MTALDPLAGVWPQNLYEEIATLRDFAALTNGFGAVLEVARKDGVKGLYLSPHGEIGRKTVAFDDVQKIVENNQALLEDSDPFQDDANKTGALTCAEIIDVSNRILQLTRAKAANITISKYDDKVQRDDLFYAFYSNVASQTVVLAFRDNTSITYDEYWKSEQVAVQMPKRLTGKLGELNTVKLHQGMYEILFKKTASRVSPFERILETTKEVLKKNPLFKLYVTGHGMGGALATLMSFFLASDPDIFAPIQAVVVSSPRVGDGYFAQAMDVLQRDGRLQLCRVVEKNDWTSHIPVTNFYHVGFQVKLSTTNEGPRAEITYPKVHDFVWNKLARGLGNSLLASYDWSFSPSKTIMDLSAHKKVLSSYGLEQIYANDSFTGWEAAVVMDDADDLKTKGFGKTKGMPVSGKA